MCVCEGESGERQKEKSADPNLGLYFRKFRKKIREKIFETFCFVRDLSVIESAADQTLSWLLDTE